MIETATQLKAKVRNLSSGDSKKAQTLEAQDAVPGVGGRLLRCHDKTRNYRMGKKPVIEYE